mmetsp:Transcript_16241/g.38088  ORF Transcript_16241/g.38088 Transcript_16241/m.38088 type:complete len:233 (-) Transcript_16241:409-1107(-)
MLQRRHEVRLRGGASLRPDAFDSEVYRNLARDQEAREDPEGNHAVHPPIDFIDPLHHHISHGDTRQHQHAERHADPPPADRLERCGAGHTIGGRAHARVVPRPSVVRHRPAALVAASRREPPLQVLVRVPRNVPRRALQLCRAHRLMEGRILSSGPPSYERRCEDALCSVSHGAARHGPALVLGEVAPDIRRGVQRCLHLGRVAAGSRDCGEIPGGVVRAVDGERDSQRNAV